MGAIADSTWMVPLASATQLYAATVIMTAGLAVSILVYQMWQQWHEGSRKVSSKTSSQVRKRD